MISSRERLHQLGVSCETSIEVPEMPLSKSFTGARKIVTPKALIIPAAVSIIKFVILNEFFILFTQSHPVFFILWHNLGEQ